MFCIFGYSENNKNKYEQLDKQYRNLMMYVAQEILHNQALAEESVQEALLQIFTHLDHICEINCHETKSWVVIITRRVALNKFKYEKRREHEAEDLLDDLADTKNDLDDFAIQEIDVESVFEGLEHLDHSHAEIIMLRYYFGYTDSQLAKQYMITSAAVRKRCQYAISQLKKYLIVKGQWHE